MATQNILEMKLLGERYPSVMMPLIDRPFIQHVVEYLVNQGVVDFYIVLSHLPEKVKALLGDGTRWGASIRYHLVKDPSRPYQPLKYAENQQENTPVLLVHADRLPKIDVKVAMPSSSGDGTILYCWHDDVEKQNSELPSWSGWGWLTEDCMIGLPENPDERELFSHLVSLPNSEIKIIDISELLSVESCKGLISTQWKVLSKRRTDLMHTGKEIEDGIWLSRNVRLHPTSRLIPPVYIGENCSIGKGVQLGPYVAVGRDCILDEKSTVTNSTILPSSYVGEELELSDVLIDKNCLVNIRLDSEVTVTDDFILSSLTEKRVKDWGKKILSQSLALALLLFLLPLFLCMTLYLKIIRKGPVFYKNEMVKLPALTDVTLWRTFSLFSFCRDFVTNTNTAASSVSWRDLFLRFLPALINVARGDIQFVGVSPRTIEEINALPVDWRSLYLKSKAGIVTEALVNFGPVTTEDELYSAETIYAVSAGWKYDFVIFAKYFGQILGVLPLPGK